jgi:hypothetical protein
LEKQQNLAHIPSKPAERAEMTNNTEGSIAVFSRNHHDHLDGAANLCSTDPDRRVLFRSKKRWVSAREAVKAKDYIPIYFVPIDSSAGLITYVARLVCVKLAPELFTEDEVREFSVATTQDEGFWEENGEHTVQTMYLISHCRKLNPSEQIRFTELRKLSDGKPIAEDFSRNYAIVEPNPGLTV